MREEMDEATSSCESEKSTAKHNDLRRRAMLGVTKRAHCKETKTTASYARWKRREDEKPDEATEITVKLETDVDVEIKIEEEEEDEKIKTPNLLNGATFNSPSSTALNPSMLSSSNALLPPCNSASPDCYSASAHHTPGDGMAPDLTPPLLVPERMPVEAPQSKIIYLETTLKHAQEEAKKYRLENEQLKRDAEQLRDCLRIAEAKVRANVIPSARRPKTPKSLDKLGYSGRLHRVKMILDLLKGEDKTVDDLLKSLHKHIENARAARQSGQESQGQPSAVDNSEINS